MLVNMRPTTKVLAAGALLGAAAVVILSVRPSLATSFGGGGALDVTVLGDVKVAQPLDTNSNITNTYVPIGMGPLGTPKIEANVAGVIEVSGYSSVPTVALENGTIVNLSTNSLNTLTATTGKGNCTYVDGDPTATLTTAINIPSSPMSGRTALEIFNHSNAPTAILICSAQGTATTTSGVRIESGDQSRKWEGLGAGVVVSCLCALGTCTYNYQEERCYQE